MKRMTLYLEACGMGAQGADTDQLWKDLKKTTSFEDPTKCSKSFARTPATSTTRSDQGFLKRAREQTLSLSARLLAIETLAFYDDPLALPPLLQAASNNGPVGAEATRWLIHLGNTRWRKYGVYDALKRQPSTTLIKSKSLVSWFQPSKASPRCRQLTNS